jgi:hypothetical protein
MQNQTRFQKLQHHSYICRCHVQIMIRVAEKSAVLYLDAAWHDADVICPARQLQHLALDMNHKLQQKVRCLVPLLYLAISVHLKRFKEGLHARVQLVTYRCTTKGKEHSLSLQCQGNTRARYASATIVAPANTPLLFQLREARTPSASNVPGAPIRPARVSLAQ